MKIGFVSTQFKALEAP